MIQSNKDDIGMQMEQNSQSENVSMLTKENQLIDYFVYSMMSMKMKHE